MSERSNEDINVSSDQTIEDGDQAQTYISQNVSLGLRSRELQRLKEVEHALPQNRKRYLWGLRRNRCSLSKKNDWKKCPGPGSALKPQRTKSETHPSLRPANSNKLLTPWKKSGRGESFTPRLRSEKQKPLGIALEILIFSQGHFDFPALHSPLYRRCKGHW